MHDVEARAPVRVPVGGFWMALLPRRGKKSLMSVGRNGAKLASNHSGVAASKSRVVNSPAFISSWQPTFNTYQQLLELEPATGYVEARDAPVSGQLYLMGKPYGLHWT